MKTFSLNNLKTAAVAAMLLTSSAGAVAGEFTAYPDGTRTSPELPIWVYWADDVTTRTEFIYTADQLTEMAGQSITSMKFYLVDPNDASVPKGFDRNYNFNINVKLANTATSAFTESAYIDEGLETVFTGILSCAKDDETMTVTFDTPFVYTGENLLVDFSLNEKVTGGVLNNYFKGAQPVSGEWNAVYGHPSPSRASFCPTVTFEFGAAAPYKAVVTPDALDFGRVPAGSSSTKIVQVKNVGSEAFTASITGLGGTPFSADVTSISLAAKESAEITVTFAPTEGGDAAATMTVDCGEAGSQEVALTGFGKADVDGVIDVYDGTDKNEFIPMHLYYADNAKMMTQMIYPASDLTRAIGQQITSIKFFVGENNGIKDDINAPMAVKMGIVEETAFPSFSVEPYDAASLTEVYNGTILFAKGQTEIIYQFDAPFIYNGGNLLVQVGMTGKGSAYDHTNFLGVTTDYNSAIYTTGQGSTYTPQKFMPYTVMTYEEPVDYAAKVSPEAIDFKMLKVGRTAVKDISVTNTGKEPFAITGTGLEGTAFSAGLPAGEVASGATVTIPVTFAPTEGGSHAATLALNLGQAGNFEVTLAGQARTTTVVDGETTVYDEADTSQRVPLSLAFANSLGTGSQVIYPAADIEHMLNQQLTSVTYFIANENGLTGEWKGTLKLSVGVTDLDAFASDEYLNIPMTELFNGEVQAFTGDQTITVPVTAPFIYTGGNLVVELTISGSGKTLSAIDYLGQNADVDCAVYKLKSWSSTTKDVAQFHPMTKFTHEAPQEYAAEVSLSEIAFGTVKTGRTSKHSFTIVNGGLKPFTVAVSGLEGTPFSAEVPAGEVTTGATVTIPVTFAPVDGGDYAATLAVNLGGAGTYEIALTGDCFVPPVVDGEVTVADDVATSETVPLNLYWADRQGMGSESIYLASDLSRMVGKQISGIRYYMSSTISSPKSWALKVEVRTTDDSYYMYAEPVGGEMSVVYSGTYSVAAGDTEMYFEFDSPFIYSGGNLAVKLTLMENGSYLSGCRFYGETTADDMSVSSTTGSTYTFNKFTPKTTFYYDDAEAYKAKVSETAIDFGSTRVENPVTKTVTIKNLGSETLNVAISGLDDTPFSASVADDVIASGSSAVVDVVYDPVDGGTHEATMTIDLGEAGTFDVALTGFCKTPPAGFYELVVGEGTDEHSSIPVLLTYVDVAGTGSQFFYPASMLTPMLNKYLASVTFYVGGDGFNKDWSAPGTFEVGMTDITTMGEENPQFIDVEGMETMFNGRFSGKEGSNEFRIQFNNPFQYTGGNLMFKLLITANGGVYPSGRFVGKVSDVNNAVGCYVAYGGPSMSFAKFYPMASILYADTTTGVESVSGDGGISVGRSGNAIAIDLGEAVNASVAVYSLAGSLVETIDGAEGTVVTKPLHNGCYIVKVNAGDRQVVRKVAF